MRVPHHLGTTADGPLLVVYDRGAATPVEIAHALGGLCGAVFAVASSDHVAQVRPVLSRFGTVVELSGDFKVDVRRLHAARPGGIVTYSEPMLPVTAEFAAALGLSFHDRATTNRLTDKLVQRETLATAGVEAIRTWPVDKPGDVPAGLAYVGVPAVLKPRAGEGSRNTYLVADERQAEELFRAGPSLLEEYLPGQPGLPFGDYVSVESLTVGGQVHHVAVTGKFPLRAPFRETGQFWPPPLPARAEAGVLELTTRALRALGVETGFTHTEVKLTPAGPRIIEVNGRLGGHVNLLYREAFGVDLVRAAALRALGRPVQMAAPSSRRVYFQYSCLPPTVPCRLVRVEGVRDVRRLPAITGYQQRFRPGASLGGGVMTQFLDLLWGVCDSHDDMAALIAQALALLTFEFEMPDGALRATGLQLREMG